MEEYDIKEFDEIRPYEPSEMKQAFNDLLNDRQFSRMLKGFVPWLPKGVRNGLLKLGFIGVKTPLDFQLRFMKPIVWHIIRKHTDGCTFDDRQLRPKASERYTFLSNHRDIVLDSAFLDVLLYKNHYPTTVEIGIGDNLLIYPWIKRLVRMNKAFTVRRGLTAHEMMRSSQLMSRYIHYAVTQKRENIWIAQREGRDNPAFKKSRQDDLDNMKTGIFGYKGRVRYCCARPVNTWIDELKDLPRKEFFAALSQRIDSELHRNYCLYPCNYIALDELNGNQQYAGQYTREDKERFEQYLQGQLAKIKIADKDEAYLRERMLTMYANPARNWIRVKSEE